jgi:hypothetical protein
MNEESDAESASGSMLMIMIERVVVVGCIAQITPYWGKTPC